MIDRLAELGVVPAEAPDSVLVEDSPTTEVFDSNLRIQAKIEKVKLAIEMLLRYRVRYKQAVTQEESTKNQAMVDKAFAIMKGDLADLDAELKELKTRSEAPEIEDSVREAMATNLSCYYKDYEALLRSSQQVYSELKNIARNILVKKMLLVDGTMSEDKIAEMVEENPQAFQQLIKQKVMGKFSNDLLYNAQDIAEKCEGIKRLQSNVKELVGMLRDINQIVSLQGEKINSIASHVSEAKDYVMRGNQDLEKAKELHAGHRCKLMAMLAIAVVLLVIVLVPIVVNVARS